MSIHINTVIFSQLKKLCPNSFHTIYINDQPIIKIRNNAFVIYNINYDILKKLLDSLKYIDIEMKTSKYSKSCVVCKTNEEGMLWLKLAEVI